MDTIKSENYTKKIIVFLDIIGISEFSLNSSNKDLIDIYKIIDRFVHIKHEHHTSPYPNIPFNVNLKKIMEQYLVTSSLSDSIIMSIPYKELILLPILIKTAAILQVIFLGKGYQ